jgi:hypothetical protein
MHMLAYGGYISLMISFGTLLMYMVDVHGCMVGTFWYMIYLVDILFMILYFIDDISFVS